jgi:3'-phosphoadenosine 5'-phosphosulfate sulfotransferase (PAPS reductase)/FAD synthetase
VNITPARFHEAISDVSRRQIVPLSGGKDSTALAVYLAQNYPHVAFEFAFCDTGAELPETYEYLDRLEHVLGREIRRISALELLQLKEKPGRTAFDVMLYEHFAGFLPSARTRWCTRMLKIHPYEQHIGSDPAYSYIAIRADEDRTGYTGSGKPVLLSEQPNILPVYPFKDQGLRLADIQRLLDDSGLGAPRYYEWRSRSGCYFCFYQQIGEWQGLKERHPELFEKAKGYEQTSSSRGYTWVDGRSLVELETLPRRAMKPKADDAGCAICHL